MIFALLLFGCADDGSQCRRLAVLPRRYEAKVTCEADAAMALQSNVALRADYPSVEARCVASGRVAFGSHASLAARAEAQMRFALGSKILGSKILGPNIIAPNILQPRPR